jgi:hypothetical protein
MNNASDDHLKTYKCQWGMSFINIVKGSWLHWQLVCTENPSHTCKGNKSYKALYSSPWHRLLYHAVAYHKDLQLHLWPKGLCTLVLGCLWSMCTPGMYLSIPSKHCHNLLLEKWVPHVFFLRVVKLITENFYYIWFTPNKANLLWIRIWL